MLLPGNLDLGFDWSEPAPFLDFLASRSVLYDVKLASNVTDKDLAAYRKLIVPFYDSLAAAEKNMVHKYQATGGHVYIFSEKGTLNGLKGEVSSPNMEEKLITDQHAQKEVESKIDILVPEATHVELQTGGHILANLTSLDHGKILVLHLLNYDSKPIANVHIRLQLGRSLKGLKGRTPTLVSPDSRGTSLEMVRWKGKMLEATLSHLDIYTLLILK